MFSRCTGDAFRCRFGLDQGALGHTLPKHVLPSTITLAAEPLGFVLTDRRLTPLSFLTYRRDSRPSRRDSAIVLHRRERTPP